MAWTDTNKNWRKNTVAGRYQTTMAHIQRRAKAKGLPCNITSTYLASITPEICPVLGIPLKHNIKVAGLDSPSIDRIDPDKGYVVGNILIVSKLANQIRSCGTPEQIIAVGEFYRKLLCEDHVCETMES